LPGGLYESEHDGALAKLEVSRGHWVFQFDRDAVATATSATAGEPPPLPVVALTPGPAAPKHDAHLPLLTEDGNRTAPTAPKMTTDYPGKYTCKRCKVVFSTLPELGSHSRKCLVDTAIAEAAQESEAAVELQPNRNT
jgi:hypothetical protein